ncbi:MULTISPECIES: DNA primase [Reichenbachiella]|uniref:DNA primase n=1 Tax=Reichenbachiella TaxID=156993 RepID=UPI000E6D0FBA|nr:DNA primase [Reichenbachiella sp. MSK19-1]MBU2916288.1 DNA primase [Reichenbachiella agariperforans]
MISNHTIEEIKNRMDIYEVISEFVDLKKSGSSYKALSPFTDEKTPSFMVSPSKNIFKCFSTGKGGDPITFLMELDGLSYMEALRFLAQKYGIELEEEVQTEEQVNAQNERESLFITLNYAKDHFVSNLWESEEGRNIGLTYFKERSFSEETIKTFELGYALDQWQGLMDASAKKGYNETYLARAGLKIVKEDKAYDRFRGRVTFPIHNVSGKVIAFGARTLKSNEKGPKYLNSPETELYTKSKILYGIFQAKNEIRNQANCYLVEGYTDVISLYQGGIKNVVASSGTSLTEDQIKLIKRYTENVTVLFDGDKAGIKASMRGIDMMLSGGLNVKAVRFPEGEDPDSYSKQLGGTAFKAYLDENSLDFISFKTELYITGTNDPIKRAEAIREIVHSISLIPDPIKRTVYVQQCSNKLGIEEGTLISELNKLLIKESQKNSYSSNSGRSQGSNPAPSGGFFPPDFQGGMPPFGMEPPPDLFADPQDLLEEKVSPNEVIRNQERESIRMLINYGEEMIDGFEGTETHLANYILTECEDIEFTTSIYERILNLFKEKLVDGQVLNLKDLLNHDDDEIKREAVNLSTERYELSHNWSDKFQISVAHERDSLRTSAMGNILRLKFRIIQKMIAENMEKMKTATDDNEIDGFLSIQKDLKEMEMAIAKELGNVTVK